MLGIDGDYDGDSARRFRKDRLDSSRKYLARHNARQRILKCPKSRNLFADPSSLTDAGFSQAINHDMITPTLLTDRELLCDHLRV
jgi:hypothetical protein